jgi:hypothetical protein
LELDVLKTEADDTGYERLTYPQLESLEILGGEGVGLRDDGDEVDSGSETLHNLDVEGLEATR